MITVLIADDDPNICKLLTMYLEREGFEAKSVFRGDDALAACADIKPDIMILDVMMPGLDGYEVLRRLREADKALPVLMLTARGEVYDCVAGLDAGADDYIVKPFKPPELIARVRALLRRSVGEDGDAVAVGPLTVSRAAYSVAYSGNQINMPPRELELLYFLCKNKGVAFTREALLDRVWDYDFMGDSRTVDVHVKRLRERLGEAAGMIQTVWGVGYKLVEN
ncbi:MAG: response regulator transcription factor [Clostridia bacterium]|nr:response regulator transcription factor [Clostridia bacterium]